MDIPSLQTAVDRYATSLTIPTMLEKLHPRAKGNPGNAGALAPAIVLTAVSAFEGFVEEFIALTAEHRNQSFAQIAKLATMNNPTIKTFDEKLRNLLQWGDGTSWKSHFTINTWKPPAVGESSWIQKQSRSWLEVKADADGWMQVRHCLSHGLARGFRPEVWPGPLRGNVSAASVLRPQTRGRHSLSLHGAESCAHVYRTGAQAIADEAARYIGHASLDWSKVPGFNL